MFGTIAGSHQRFEVADEEWYSLTEDHTSNYDARYDLSHSRCGIHPDMLDQLGPSQRRV